MKLIVAGSRSVSNYNIFRKYLDDYRKNTTITAIISGGANGADKFGEIYANDNNISLEIYLADWNKFGKSAGYRRNEIMARKGDLLIVFWDGESRGTYHMINIAKDAKIPITTIKDPRLFKQTVRISQEEMKKYDNYSEELNKIESDAIIHEYFWDVSENINND